MTTGHNILLPGRVKAGLFLLRILTMYVSVFTPRKFAVSSYVQRIRVKSISLVKTNLVKNKLVNEL